MMEWAWPGYHWCLLALCGPHGPSRQSLGLEHFPSTQRPARGASTCPPLSRLLSGVLSTRQQSQGGEGPPPGVGSGALDMGKAGERWPKKAAQVHPAHPPAAGSGGSLAPPTAAVGK